MQRARWVHESAAVTAGGVVCWNSNFGIGLGRSRGRIGSWHTRKMDGKGPKPIDSDEGVGGGNKPHH